jgi:hypothetical protein
MLDEWRAAAMLKRRRIETAGRASECAFMFSALV